MTTLFDQLPPAAAKADPATSHEASAEITASGQRANQARDVAAMVQRKPGRTSRELAEECGVDRHMVAKRLPDAERMGLVQRGGVGTCRISGRPAIAWFPVEGSK